MEGYIYLHKKILDWDWYQDNNSKSIFIHCLLKANFEDKQWRGILIKRGQFFTSIDILAKELNLTTKQIRVGIEKLKKTQELGTQGASNGTMITVCKYDTYQTIKKQKGKQQGKQGANEGATTNKDIINNKYIYSEFYDLEIEKLKDSKSDDKIINEYKKFIAFLFGTNSAKCQLSTPLKMPKQVNFNQYCKLSDKANFETICNKLYALQNNKKYENQYVDLYMTLQNWLSMSNKK
jgi:hypothetical protein